MTCALARAGLHRGDPACAVTCGETTRRDQTFPDVLQRGSGTRWQTGPVHFRGAVLLVGLLTGVLLPAVVPASLADPTHRRTDSVSARLYPPVVTTGEPSVIAGRITPVDAGVDIQLQQEQENGTWQTITVTRTDGRGAYGLSLDTSSPGGTSYRVSTTGATSKQRVLRVEANTACRPRTQPVDPQATGEAICLLTRIDRWRAAGLMGVGQQLNISSLAETAFEPLAELDDPVAVVGFDLEELAKTGEYQYPFLDEQLDHLLTLADQGAVLTASWHATNPGTGGDYTDRSWRTLEALLKPRTAAARAFWADFDEKLELLRRFEDGDGGRHGRTAVVFRPLHEANGGFFWWGKPDPKVYRTLWKRMQERAAAAGVHNIVWAYAANRWTAGVKDPRPLVPAEVDLGGLDSYDPERGRTNLKDRLWLEGYPRVTPVPRMALTEVGPHGSATGAWDPTVITRTVRKAGIRPAWAMLWFDDGNGRDGITGKKQIGSLSGGRAWLRTCPNGLCAID